MPDYKILVPPPRRRRTPWIIGAAVLGLISAYADEAPLLLTVDDAQWLDRASTEAIGFAARRLVADPVAVIIAVREGEESPLLAVALPELRPAGLDRESAAELNLQFFDQCLLLSRYADEVSAA